MRNKVLLYACFLFGIFTLGCKHSLIQRTSAKNIIFVIVDGMGPEQVKAGRIFSGNEPLIFEKFAHQSTVTTHNLEGQVTDSAAAATAIATGHKVKNRVISPDKTILEHFKEQGKSTGIVTNVLLTDATPACFAAHAQFRSDTKEILNSYLFKTQPNFIAGADEPDYIKQVQKSPKNYNIIKTNSYLKDVLKRIQSGEKIDYIYAGFGLHPLIPGHFDRETGLPLSITDNSFFQQKDIPRISQLAEAALDILNQNPKGFFLLIESGLVDWIGHKNTDFSNDSHKPSAIDALSEEMLETNNMVSKITSWAQKHPDTLIIVTADHETGGLKIDDKNTACLGQKGCLAKSYWTSDFYPNSDPQEEKFSMHTGVPVGVYAQGPGSEAFNQAMDNTEFFNKILGLSS